MESERNESRDLGWEDKYNRKLNGSIKEIKKSSAGARHEGARQDKKVRNEGRARTEVAEEVNEQAVTVRWAE